MGSDTDKLLAFAQAADDIDDLDQLTAMLAEALVDVGVTSISANRIAAPRRDVQPGILFGKHWAEWSGHYGRCRYHIVDPAYRMLRIQSRCFLWTEAVTQFPSRAGRRVLDACRDYTGAGEGFVVPVHDRGALFSAAFCGPALEIAPALKPALHVAGAYYVARGLELIEGVQLDPACPLTRQQLQCLAGVLAGETDMEIGQRLGLSRWTVHHHIEIAKHRLNVSKRSVAAQEAWRRGWLD